jgi:hypothetical protein
MKVGCGIKEWTILTLTFGKIIINHIARDTPKITKPSNTVCKEC